MVQSLPRGTEENVLWDWQTVAVNKSAVVGNASSASVAPLCSATEVQLQKKQERQERLFNVTLCFQMIIYTRWQEMSPGEVMYGRV